MSILDTLSSVNLLAVLVAGIGHMAVGLIWFMPALFGNAWVKFTGKDLKPARPWIVPGIIGHLVIALGLAMIIVATDSISIVGALFTGFLIWICFVVTLELGELIWEKIPFQLFLIRIGNHLIALTVTCFILAIWR